MLSKIKRWWKFRKNGINAEIAKHIGWLEMEVEGQKLKLFDCRAFSLSQMAMTPDREIAARFATSRNADGRELIGRHPESPTTYTSDHIFPRNESPPEGPLFKAIQMEDKWDIFHYEGVFYFARSWTGDLIVRVDIEPAEGGFKLARIECNSSVLPEGEFALRFVECLLKSHCLDMISPHPLPADIESKDEIALIGFSFSNFGRRAWFGCYESTVGIYNKTRYDFREHDTKFPTE